MVPPVIRVIICSLLSAAVCANEKHDISLVVMAPFPDELTVGWERGPALLPGAVIAVREVNNNTNILPNFNLQLIVADSGCSVTSKVTISFLRDIFNNKKHQVVGIIGPGCSAAALEVSNLTSKHQVSLIHVTPSATSPQLEDAARNTTYATISSALSFVQSFIALMTYNNWNNVATLQDESRLYFKQTHSNFMKVVDNGKVIYTGSLFPGVQSNIPLDDLRSSRARVVMVFAGSQLARQLLCSAYHKDMLYPNFQWIFHDRTKGQLIKNISNFRVGSKVMKCTDKEMIRATEGVILNHIHLEQENKNVTLPLLGRSYDDYYKEYVEELEKYRIDNGLEDNPPDVYANPYHDAVWAMAIALHNASMNGVDLNSYTYGRNNDTVEIANQLSRVSFDGISGPITFQSDTRSVKTIIDIKQLLDGEEQLIGTFGMELQFSNDNKTFINDIYEKKYEKVHISVGVITIFLTVLLIVLTFLLQLANTIWYNHRSIKATSPNITHLVFSGCYLFSIALLILAIQETFTFPPTINTILYSTLCNAFAWCFLIGYTLIFGTICTKLWRVYRLFRHFRNEKPGCFLSDNSLVMFVTILLGIDIIICTTWNIVDPWMLRTVVNPSTSGTPILYIRSDCSCRHVTKWVITIALYKGTIMILLVALSIMNRRIKRKDFQHTRKINILIYGITMLAGTGMPLYFLLKNRSIYIGFMILTTILLSTILLSCISLFLPPILPVLKVRIMGKEEESEGKTPIVQKKFTTKLWMSTLSVLAD